MKRLLIILCLLLQMLFAEAQMQTDNPMKTRIDSIVSQLVGDYISDTIHNALSIGIVVNGKEYTYNYGTTERGKHSLPDRNTVYEIGSISKTFTGTLLAQALIDNKINLDDDIRKYLNGSYPNLEYQGQPLKLAHIVNHTSRLPRFLPDMPELFNRPPDSIPLLFAAANQHYTKEKFLKDLHSVKIDTFPGYNYQYSNPGAQLASLILEKVYGRAFGELVAAYIARPLGMKHTSVALPGAGVRPAKGYDQKGRVMPYVPPLSLGAGGVYSSLPDMLAYVKFHLDEKNKPAALSHQPTRRDTVNDNATGLFWRINKTSGKDRQVWHTGGTLGFSSYCVLYPGSGIGIILLSNELDPNSQGALIDIADRLYNALPAR